MSDPASACPFFRPGKEQLQAIAEEVAEVGVLQQTLRRNHPGLPRPDRVAHQYQIAGGKIALKIADTVPVGLEGVGLFHPGADYTGIGRISTGLGTPHIETNPDFLGFMAAFQTRQQRRVDFLGINHPASPTDNHREFVDVLFATAESAGAKIPFIGEWGQYNLGNLAAEQMEFASALVRRLGAGRAAQTLAHIVKQTLRTFHSSSACQTYWTGIVEVGATLGKFTFAPLHAVNRRPGFRPGERHLSQQWRGQQAQGDIGFAMFWIPYLDESSTSTVRLTAPWEERHKQLVAHLTFPQAAADSDTELWAALASEMGANPGNWVCNREDSIAEPATEFGTARKIAYALSQRGRNALDPAQYQSVFETGQIVPALAQELARRREEKGKAGQVDCAP